MEDILNIKFRGLPVEQEVLRRIWGEIRIDLAKDFPIARAIDMPTTQAWRVPSKEYIRILKKLKGSSHIIDTSEEEWRTKTGPEESSASLTHLDDPQTWWVLKREEFGNSLETDLKHELTHIFEAIMLLPWGTLTRIIFETGKSDSP